MPRRRKKTATRADFWRLRTNTIRKEIVEKLIEGAGILAKPYTVVSEAVADAYDLKGIRVKIVSPRPGWSGGCIELRDPVNGSKSNLLKGVLVDYLEEGENGMAQFPAQIQKAFKEWGVEVDEEIEKTKKSVKSRVPPKPKEKAKTTQSDDKHGVLLPVEPSDYIEPEWARFLFHTWDKMTNRPAAVCLSGPRGTGKTLAALVYAARKKKKCLIVNCNDEFTAETFVGFSRIKPGPQDYWQYGPVADAAKHDYVLVLDEFNVVSTSAQVGMNPLLDDVQEGIYLPYTGERISWKEPSVILCINEGYAGTRELQGALKDRCEHLQAEYLDPDSELKILVWRTGIDEGLALNAITTANAIRAATKEDYRGVPIDFDLSPRALISYADRVVAGQDANVAWFQAVINRAGCNLANRNTRQMLISISRDIGGFDLPGKEVD